VFDYYSFKSLSNFFFKQQCHAQHQLIVIVIDFLCSDALPNITVVSQLFPFILLFANPVNCYFYKFFLQVAMPCPTSWWLCRLFPCMFLVETQLVVIVLNFLFKRQCPASWLPSFSLVENLVDCYIFRIFDFFQAMMPCPALVDCYSN